VERNVLRIERLWRRTVGRSVALFFLCVMVRHIMARFFNNAISTNVTALAVPARTLVSPGTLVFLG
jgi:hypothetical protein